MVYYTGGSKRTFTSNQYLNHHITYKHPGHENIPKTAAETCDVLSPKKSSPLPNGKFCLDAENSSILTDTVKREDHVKKENGNQKDHHTPSSSNSKGSKIWRILQKIKQSKINTSM